MVEVEASDFFVELFGEDVDLVLVLFAVLVELDLGDDLVGETGAHDEAGVAGRATEVEESTFGEDEDGVPVGEDPFVVLGFDVAMDDAGCFLETRHVDFVIEVADVADDGFVFHLGHVVCHDDVFVAGGGDKDVDVADDID